MNKLDFFLIHLTTQPAQLTQSHLDELIAGERFGYDGLWIYEDGNREAPPHIPTATRVAAHTHRIPIGVVGHTPALYDDPLRVAEEIAMLDVGSGGRAIAGFVRGTGTEQDANGLKRYSPERFWEMHDLIVKAWTEPAPFQWRSTHYELTHVNPWPRPRQRPHPPIWLAGSRTLETIEKAAERRYPFMTTFAPQWLTRASFDMYRRAANKRGYEPSPKQLVTLIPTYVAETEDQAHREARPYLTRLFENCLKGYRELAYEELLDERYVIVGSAQAVIERLTELSDDEGAGIVIGAGGRIGSMPHWMVMKNTQLIAEEVIPHFRGPGGKPSWANEGSARPPALGAHAPIPGRSHRPVLRPSGGSREARTERATNPAGRSPAVAGFTGTGLTRRCGGSGA